MSSVISYDYLLRSEHIFDLTKGYIYLSQEQKAEIVNLSSRRIGDHLVTARTGYAHHGIYIGSDKVIHYSGFADGMNKGKIETTSLKDFMNGKCTFVKRWKNPIYRGDEVVKRAKSRLGEDEYNLLMENCEHFAVWCIMGKKESEQVNQLLDVIQKVARRTLKDQSNDWTKIVFPGKMPLPYENSPLRIPDEFILSTVTNTLFNSALSSMITKEISQKVVSSAMLKSASGLGSQVLPVGATILAAKTIYDNRDTIKEVAVNVVDTTTEFIGDTVEAVGEGIDTVVTGAIDFLGDLFS